MRYPGGTVGVLQRGGIPGGTLTLSLDLSVL